MADVGDQDNKPAEDDPFPKNERITTVIPFRHWAMVSRSSPSPSLSGTGVMETPMLSCQRGGGILPLLLRNS